MMHEIAYAGRELELFQNATVWKSYVGTILRPYLLDNVLEVGAGIGGTTPFLCDGTQRRWVCLEPDPQLYAVLKQKIDDGVLPSCCVPVKGITIDLPQNEKYNAVLYVDVIEHIENDYEELKRAKSLLLPGGHLIVLVPAHQFLFSEFDAAIGHHRRYNKRLLRQVVPTDMELVTLRYLDSCGFFASLAKKIFLRREYPTLKQVRFWDKHLVGISTVTDKLSAYKFGKSLVGIWKNR